ncbi:PucR family transcriptional regulator [Pseudonocardia endophytica]|uniref:PucR-like helix-turn-helix protein n=1 Tax=Pseudonocardia endophytica TaxID=401976 RepID=A0A4R1HWT1_PSEEN|nr:helix-turn-helix domain-containing protein [Pseudonocardia endophytica]TCK22002.1 PucR-like helix-turn-helix protein [Pseudonocardia endophytica]
MYGLLLRLSALDADAASALRVIGFYDVLVEQSASVDVILQRTAALAGCAVGLRRADTPHGRRADVNTPVHDGTPPIWARIRAVPEEHEVWVERLGAELPLDDLLLERFALASSVALSRRQRDVEVMDGPALLRLAIDSTADETRRRSALNRMGLTPNGVVHVVAADGAPDAVDVLARQAGHLLARASVDTVHALVFGGPVSTTSGVPTGVRAGIAAPHPAVSLPDAWREAGIALRYALPSRHDHPPYSLDEAVAVRYAALGGFGLLAERMSPEAIGEVADVRALDGLADDPAGEELLHTLEVVASTESIRRAATILHLHHNTVAHRVARAEKVLGFSLAEPYSRSRLMLALVLRRLRDSAEPA